MEQTSASIARRTEHDKKALVAEWESKLSLLNAERTSEKRDLNLTIERQQVCVFKTKCFIFFKF